MKNIIKLSLVWLLSITIFTGCSDDNKESAEVKKAKEIMAKNIIEEDKKMEERKRKRANGQGTFLIDSDKSK
jgi:hypothetical protein